MKAGRYLRLSSDRSGDGYGVDRQRQDAIDLIKRRGWTAGPEFLDNNRSAARGKQRPAFQQLLRTIEAGQLEAVVAWNLDRLARTARDRLALIEACQKHRVLIALVRGSDIDCSTAAGRMTAGILGEVAQHEIDQKSERQVRASEQAAEQGRRVGGRRPFGFEQDGVTVRQAEADAIRRAYRDVLVGVSLTTIAREWNSSGLNTGKTRFAKGHEGQPSRWTHDTVRRVLMNPRNAGIRALRGEERAPAVWEALVPEETYRAAVRVLSEPTRFSGGTGTPGRQLLSGVALCSCCGATVHGGGASHRKPIYRCSGREGGASGVGTGVGHHVNRLAEPCDDYVTAACIARLCRPDAPLLTRSPDDGLDVAALRDEAQVVRVRLDSFAAEFADGELTASQLRVATERMRKRLAVIEDQIADAGRVDVLAPLVGSRRSASGWDDEVAAAWEALGRDRQRIAINLMATVILHPPGRGTRTFRPETVEIRWK